MKWKKLYCEKTPLGNTLAFGAHVRDMLVFSPAGMVAVWIDGDASTVYFHTVLNGDLYMGCYRVPDIPAAQEAKLKAYRWLKNLQSDHRKERTCRKS